MEKSDVKILVGCEESQRVVSEWRARGYEAYSCDLLPCSGGHPEWHVLGDVAPLVNGHCKFRTMDGVLHEIKGEWTLAQYFTPCTFFSTASACRLFHRDPITGESKLDKGRYQKGLAMRRLFMTCYNSKCGHIAMENPTPMGIWNLPIHTQVIQPWMFTYKDENGETKADPFKKRTLLWLKGLPRLAPQIFEEPDEVKRWVNAGKR